MAELLDPQTMDDIQREEAQRRYVDAVQRGETGARLARSVGIQVPVGTSPPTFTPPQSVMPPPMRLDSSANYVRYAPGDQEDSFWQNMMQRMGGLPIDQAQKAIQVALKFQSERGFQSDIASGMEPARAAMKWASGLSRSTLSGIASLARANRPEQAYEFMPGDTATGRPAAWVPKGGMGRPINIPQSSLPGVDGRKTIHSPGVGIFEYNPETKTWDKSVDFGNKAPKFSARRVSIDPQTGQVMTVSGDPEDPVIKKFMDQAKEVAATPESGRSLLKPWTWFNGGTAKPSGQISVPESLAAPETTAPIVPQPTRTQATPFKEGQRIRSKSDPSKVYVVRNGKPVLVEE